ncbi:putative DNA polymerase III, beta subunit [Pantoea phage vB_PagM_AAM37]|uniref:Putative DNA polymerase III, beta subunit n=1 Tax=Pantoea phage vB_PagM_AAM37 TaxID=2588093 RepID=A0A513ZYD7_9CAUD|nr:putative DNA polymerase III, beta subunit [Pantoea phage vB_PagM_AAM37]QDH45713.1 putative DNA polymerase III, beta subunit [Pantoea phage vB_PagM_AAM37]
MKIIVPVKILKAHNIIKGNRETNLALNGVFITKEQIISSDGKLLLVSENKLNPRQRADYLVKIDHIPAGVSMAVIDTDMQLCYFLDRIVSHSTLADIDLTEQFKAVSGARVLRYPYPDVRPHMAMTHGAISSVKLSAHVLGKITALTKAIGSRTGEVELNFQKEKTGTINAVIRQGATVLSLFLKPMK